MQIGTLEIMKTQSISLENNTNNKIIKQLEFRMAWKPKPYYDLCLDF